LKRFIVLLVVAVVAGAAIGGSFVGGVALGKTQGKEEAAKDLQTRASQFGSRLLPGGQTGTSGTTGFTPGAVPGGAVFTQRGVGGTVEKIEGDTVTVKSADGSTVLVLTSTDTNIQINKQGTLADLAVGENITVMGEKQADGTVKATGIFTTQGERIMQVAP